MSKRNAVTLPPDWRKPILRLLRQPGIAPDHANNLRKWLGWRKLPPSHWPKMRDIASRVGLPDLAHDFGSFE